MVVKDLEEGLDAQGFIVTGVDSARVPTIFQRVLDDLIDQVDENVSVYVCGSVATGRAMVGHSDIDIVTFGMDPAHAEQLARQLSKDHAKLAREVAIGAWNIRDLAQGDAGYGNRVFLKHYCAWLAGPDPATELPRFRGDVLAARGFNGDFPAMAAGWEQALVDLGPESPEPVSRVARRIGRKSLFAVSGLVSVHDQVWTTDRATSADRWGQLHPDLTEDLSVLLDWGDETTSPTTVEVARVLRTSVRTLVGQFESDIGAWSTTV